MVRVRHDLKAESAKSALTRMLKEKADVDISWKDSVGTIDKGVFLKAVITVSDDTATVETSGLLSKKTEAKIQEFLDSPVFEELKRIERTPVEELEKENKLAHMREHGMTSEEYDAWEASRQ